MTLAQEQKDRDTKMLSLEKLNGWLMTAALALLGWLIVTTQDMSVRIAVIEERTAGFNYSQIEARVESLELWNTNLSKRLADTQADLVKLLQLLDDRQ